MDLIGIENEAEFFPSGTLSDVLKEELQDITARWSGLEKNSHPVERLTRVASPAVETLRQVRNTSDQNRRRELVRESQNALLAALGYTWKREAVITALEGALVIPIVAKAADATGRNALWVIEAPLPDAEDEATDPLGASFTADQFPPETDEAALLDRSIESLLAEGVFELPDGPRHVLVMGLSQIALIDKRKWPARSVLRFDLQEIFTRAERDTLIVMACLISREARVPEHGAPISDRLEEEAQRNANAVTTSLKRTVRDAIELMGQEVLDVTGGTHKGVWIDGPELSRECLRYMYRLLFLFYAEANPRLNLLDLKNPIYATGYSLETLRDLESVPLRTTVDRDGTFLWESLQQTLNLLYTGLDLADAEKGTGLRLPAVKVSLLDPKSTPILNALPLRNEAIQKVIRLLSLRSTGKSTGRISYAKLGIGQLGAVYETLISFTGVVAKTDLIELKPRKGRSAGADDEEDSVETDEDLEEEIVEDSDEAEEEIFRRDKIDPLAPSWFVPRSRIGEFEQDEIVFKGSEALVYPKGTFIYRLAGRDREKSASYYTPEPLARLLVKHALMERCRDLTADDLLDLKILEPAMGSAAFLVETTNQLADLYLERKQKETGKTIPQDRIVVEKQKVRAFIADRNCFGVDLNPIAVELGAISLWLNSLHASDFSPWFGDQLHAGNSLIGARRAAYKPVLLNGSSQKDLWLNAKPDEIGWRNRLPENHVWHWLLPAKDMANFDKDKSIKPFAGDAQDQIKEWRKGGFFKKLEPHEVKLVQKLSRIAEALFDQVAEDLAKTRAAANDEITLWPGKVIPGNKGLDFHAKEKLNAHLIGADHATNTLPYKRLKTAMDAWCALWLWPLDKADLLPNRAEFLQGMAMILEGGFTPDGSLAAPSMDEFVDPSPDFLDLMEPDAPARDLFKAPAKRQDGLFRETNVEALIETFDWLGVAVDVAERERFVHFDLIFADVMHARGGFDVIVGNPPWAKPSWNEGLVLADIDPLYAGLSASDAKKVLGEALPKASAVRRDGRTIQAVEAFLQDFVSTRGAMEVTSSAVMNPFAGAGSNNLYRCFVDLSFRLCSTNGISALVHQDGHLGDPKAGNFRAHWYRRVIKHFNFVNMIASKNFADAAFVLQFSLNIYRGDVSPIGFDQFTLAHVASQVDESYLHDGVGDVPGLRREDGKWEVSGHKARVIRINRDRLGFMHSFIESGVGHLEETRFSQPFSEPIMEFLEKISSANKINDVVKYYSPTEISPVKSGGRSWYTTTDLSEVDDVRNGVISTSCSFKDLRSTVIQGPHFFVATPYNKSAKRKSVTHADYDSIQLEEITDTFVPRSKFGVSWSDPNFLKTAQACRWDKSLKHADLFRLAVRRRINLTSERSLIAAIIPSGCSHIGSVRSIAFSNAGDLVNAAALLASLPFDAIYKMSGRADFHDADAQRLPWVSVCETAKNRILRLSCLTKDFGPLWREQYSADRVLGWSIRDERLLKYNSPDISSDWTTLSPYRDEFTRRLALIEIDVLVSMALGLSLDELIQLYRTYFPVLIRKEENIFYDATGKIVWTSAKGMGNFGWISDKGRSPTKSEWEKLLEACPKELTCNVIDDTIPEGPREVVRHFIGPFIRCDRIEDYRRAWAHFERLKSEEAA